MQSTKGWEKSCCQFYDGLSIDYCGSYEGQLSHITRTLNFIQKIQKSKRMNWLSKEIKMYICKFFQRKNSSWFWLYFVVTITIIQKTIALQQENTPVTWSCISSGEKLALVFWIIQQENTLVTSSFIDWVRKWREFSGLITERCKYNPGWLSTTNGKLSWDSNTTL